MKSDVIFFVLTILINLNAVGQDFCFTESSPDMLKDITPQHLKAAAPEYTLRLAVHIMKRSDGTGGRDIEDVNTLLSVLNKDFLPHGICFEMKVVDEILSDAYFNYDTDSLKYNGENGKFDKLPFNQNYDAIDVYYYPDDRFNAGIAAKIPSTAFAIGGRVRGDYVSTTSVLSHELGHCLGLFHTFTDMCGKLPEGKCRELVNGSNCETCGDLVCDTPPDPSPFLMSDDCIYLEETCLPRDSIVDANGDPYNPNPNLIMAYIRPSCMESFTLGQGERMRAHLANIPVFQPVIVSSPALTLYTKDGVDDFGVEPNTSTKYAYLSSDIWIRRQNDGLTDNTHQNPEHSSTKDSNQLNYVYVRVRNAGCVSSDGMEQLALHWTKASTGALNWPSRWDGTQTVGPAGQEVVAGNIIGTVDIPVLDAGEETVLVFSWNPPNPADYDFNDQPWHFCLLSRIIANNDPITPYSNIGAYVWGNNNVAWKNISVIDKIPGAVYTNEPCPIDLFKNRSASVGVGNFSNINEAYDLMFSVPEEEIQSAITQHGTVLISFAEGLYNEWKKGGKLGEGFAEVNFHDGLISGIIGSNPIHNKLFEPHRKIFEVTANKAIFKNISLKPNENYNTAVMVLYPKINNTSKKVFKYDVVQFMRNTNEVVGGVQYQIHKPVCDVSPINAGGDVYTNVGCEVNLIANNQVPCAIYEWTDQFGNVVSREATYNTIATQSSSYNLKSVTQAGCVNKDIIQVSVNNQLCEPSVPIWCFSKVVLHPNPSSSNVLYIDMVANVNVEINISIRNVLIGHVMEKIKFTVSEGENQIPFDISGYSKGLYQVTITCPDGKYSPYNGLFKRQ
jgi:hypothetical protein